jgi:DNA-directed RNA polymerase specialized sigma subunit
VDGSLELKNEQALIRQMRAAVESREVATLTAALLNLVNEEIYRKSRYLAKKGFEFDEVSQTAYLIALEAINTYSLRSTIKPSRYIMFMVNHRLPRELRQRKYSATIPDSWYKYCKAYKAEELEWIEKNKTTPSRSQINFILEEKMTPRDIRDGLGAALTNAHYVEGVFYPVSFELEEHDHEALELKTEILSPEIETILESGKSGADVALQISALSLTA